MQCLFHVSLTALGLTIRQDREAKSMLLSCVQRPFIWTDVAPCRRLLLFLSPVSKTFPSNVRQIIFGQISLCSWFIDAFFPPLLELPHGAFSGSHLCTASLSCLLMCLAWVNFSNMFMALYCTVEILLYIYTYIYINRNIYLFILSISKEMLVLSMSTRTLLTSVQSYQLVWIYCVL